MSEWRPHDPERRPCLYTWRAGILTPPGPEGPSDKARCSYARGHDGLCSYLDEAIARGWKPPQHVYEEPKYRPRGT